MRIPPELPCGLFVMGPSQREPPQFPLKEGTIKGASLFDPDGLESRCGATSPPCTVGISVGTPFILAPNLPRAIDSKISLMYMDTGGGMWMDQTSNLKPELYHVGIMSGNQTRPRCLETSQWISSREYL